MAVLLRGAPAAAARTEALKVRCKEIRESGIMPTLAILRVSSREDDVAYEKAAIRRCEKIGIKVRSFVLPAQCETADLLETIDRINHDAGIHGCLMFRPLRDPEAERAACARLSPEKDVDGMTPVSLARVYSGEGCGFAPCTAEACIRLLEHYDISLSGKRVAILGRSLVVGKPLAMLMLSQNATVTICHSKTPNAAAISRNADIIVAAMGKANAVDTNYFSENQIVLDVGIHEQADESLCGDVLVKDAEACVAAYSPVPGGVGSMTTTVLAEHVLEACEKSLATTHKK